MDFTIAFKILCNEDLIISTAPRKSREQLIFIYLVPKVSEVRENHLIMIYKTHFYNSNKQNAVITSNVIMYLQMPSGHFCLLEVDVGEGRSISEAV